MLFISICNTESPVYSNMSKRFQVVLIKSNTNKIIVGVGGWKSIIIHFSICIFKKKTLLHEKVCAEMLFKKWRSEKEIKEVTYSSEGEISNLDVHLIIILFYSWTQSPIVSFFHWYQSESYLDVTITNTCKWQ